MPLNCVKFKINQSEFRLKQYKLLEANKILALYPLNKTLIRFIHCRISQIE